MQRKAEEERKNLFTQKSFVETIKLEMKTGFEKIHSIMKLGLIRKPALQPKIIQFV